MRRKRIAIIMSVLGILLIAAGIGTFVYKEVKTNKKNKEEIENTIINDHNALEAKINAFNEMRGKYYSDVNENLYPETVELEYENWLKVLDEYTNVVDDFEKASEYLKENCVGKNYSNKDMEDEVKRYIEEVKKIVTK